jgi:MacB-like periplasmic core domain
VKSLRRLWMRFRNLFAEGRLDRELTDELTSHLEMHIADNLRAGMSPLEARRQALIKLGGLEQTKQLQRDQRGFPFLDSLLIDLRFACRTVRKSAGSTAIAILTLALSIGASTIIFSAVYNVFFHALPYKDFNRSVVFEIRNIANAGGWKGRSFFSPDEFRAFREQNHIFEEMISYGGVRALYDDGKSARYLPRGAVVSANTFDYLGVPPLLGRAISQQDGEPDAPPVFVMNYRLWQQQFNGDPRILNTTFILDGKPTTLIGIMPPQFNAFDASFWRPGAMDGGASLMGRLKPGMSVQTAQADLDVISHRLQKENLHGIFRRDSRFSRSPFWIASPETSRPPSMPFSEPSYCCS